MTKRTTDMSDYKEARTHKVENKSKMGNILISRQITNSNLLQADGWLTKTYYKEMDG